LQRFDVEVFLVVTQAALETCFDMSALIPNAAEDEGFSASATANVHFDTLIRQNHVVSHSL
jgi:hypothetical protein